MKKCFKIILLLFSKLFPRSVLLLRSLSGKNLSNSERKFFSIFQRDHLLESDFPADRQILIILKILADRRYSYSVLRKTLIGLLLSEIIALFFLSVNFIFAESGISFSLIAIVLLSGIICGFLFGLALTRYDLFEIARQLDRQFDLKDQILTALSLIRDRRSDPLSKFLRISSAEILKKITVKDFPLSDKSKPSFSVIFTIILFTSVCLMFFSHHRMKSSSDLSPVAQLVLLSKEVRNEMNDSLIFKQSGDQSITSFPLSFSKDFETLSPKPSSISNNTKTSNTKTANPSNNVKSLPSEITDILRSFKGQITTQLDELDKSANDWKETLAVLANIKGTIRQTITQLENTDETKILKQLGSDFMNNNFMNNDDFARIGKMLNEGNWSIAASELSKTDLKKMSESQKKKLTDLLHKLPPNSSVENNSSSDHSLKENGNSKQNSIEDLDRLIQKLTDSLNRQEFYRSVKESLQRKESFLMAKQSIFSDALMMEEAPYEKNNEKAHNFGKRSFSNKTPSVTQSSDKLPGQSSSETVSAQKLPLNSERKRPDHQSSDTSGDNTETSNLRTSNSGFSNSEISSVDTIKNDFLKMPPSEIEIFLTDHSDPHNHDHGIDDRSEEPKSNTPGKLPIRPYRRIWREYQKKNESVLNSEPIPPEKRRIIQKYFESIRPDNEPPPSN